MADTLAQTMNEDNLKQQLADLWDAVRALQRKNVAAQDLSEMVSGLGELTLIFPADGTPFIQAVDAEGVVMAQIGSDVNGDLYLWAASPNPGNGNAYFGIGGTLTAPTVGLTLNTLGAAFTGKIAFLNGITGYPIRKSSTWHTALFSGATGTTALLAAYIYYIPFWIDHSVTVTDIEAAVNAGAAGAKARLGIYNNNNGAAPPSEINVPGQLVLDAGEVDCAAAAVKAIAGLSTALNPGLYWLALLNKAAITWVSSTLNPGFLGINLTASAIAPISGAVESRAYASGFPASATPTMGAGAMPVIAIRIPRGEEEMRKKILATIVILAMAAMLMGMAMASPGPSPTSGERSCLPRLVMGRPVPCDFPHATATKHPVKKPHPTPTRWKDCGSGCGP